MMKTFNKLIVFALALFLFGACDQNYIDDISKADPGADEGAPTVTITSPVEGYQIKVPEAVVPVTIAFKASDDVELASVSVLMDGTEIAKYTDFMDYRRTIKELEFDNVTNGSHELKIIATDINGKSTTSIVNFEKVSPYDKKYDGEVFYMPFDGDYMELISFKAATKVGNPGFAGVGVLGGNSYEGAPDSYITFPTNSLVSDEFSATFWYKVDPIPGRAGILSAGSGGEDRTKGIRLFREGNETEQRLKLNVGTGAGESWNDGAVIDATTGDWVHVAITISATENTMYFNGVPVRTSEMPNAMDWTGVEKMTIGAGGETFSYWDHLSDLSYIDELRFYTKALSANEIQTILYNDKPYEAKYDGEILYMPFEGNNKNWVTDAEATKVGSPGFADGKKGQAYSGAADSYLTLPAEGLKSDEFTAVFWMNINTSAERAGILSAGAGGEDRTKGIRLFREGNDAEQRIKMNVGMGEGESWNDGGVIDVTTDDWVHVAITISPSKNTIYFNGEEILSSEMTGFSWEGVENLTIGAGGETFSYWDHLSDPSLIDELRMFDKALSQTEVQGIYDAEK